MGKESPRGWGETRIFTGQEGVRLRLAADREFICGLRQREKTELLRWADCIISRSGLLRLRLQLQLQLWLRLHLLLWF